MRVWLLHMSLYSTAGQGESMAAKYRRWTPEVVRARIKTSLLVRALMDHVLGNKEMAATQVSAGLGLLRKVMPDLSQMDVKAAQDEVTDLSTAELYRRISALEGAAAAQRSPEQPTEVH